MFAISGAIKEAGAKQTLWPLRYLRRCKLDKSPRNLLRGAGGQLPSHLKDKVLGSWAGGEGTLHPRSQAAEKGHTGSTTAADPPLVTPVLPHDQHSQRPLLPLILDGALFRAPLLQNLSQSRYRSTLCPGCRAWGVTVPHPWMWEHH